MISKEQVLEALKAVIDPELLVNIIDLGLVYDVFIEDGGKVTIQMTLTSPGCPLSMVFEELVPAAVKNVKSVTSVMIDLVWEPAWNPDMISDETKEELGIIK